MFVMLCCVLLGEELVFLSLDEVEVLIYFIFLGTLSC